ncbi:13924_t:CDS:2 [Entrophospora sp. SA101]|nr:13924_t:CDS:2 [Entrophospora sp. SA101]
MYKNWAIKNGYQVKLLDYVDGDSSIGFKSASLQINGEYVYGWCKYESGVHRLVRNSPFDIQNKRHTTFALVKVSPDVEDDDLNLINISPTDLKVETFRASGPGGQHVNTTESAVRITHLPTKITAQCQGSRSQHSNKADAMKLLKSRLYNKVLEENSLNLPMCKVTSFAHLSTATTSNLDEETYEPQITFIINENNIITQQSFQKSFQTVTPTSCNSNKNNNGDANYHHNAYHENVYLLSMNDMTSPPSISHPHGFYSGPSSLAHSPQSLPIFSCEKNIFLNSSFDNKNVLRDPCLVETFYDTAKYHIDDKSKDANFNTSPLIEFTTCEQEPLAPLFDLLDNNNENIQ